VTATAAAKTGSALVEDLLGSDEPVVRYLTRVLALGEWPDSGQAQREREKIPSGTLARALLGEVGRDGLIHGRGPYSKWRGCHWVLAFLSELGYPPGERKLRAMADRAATWALSIEPRMIDGRWRRCASQQAYAVLYLMKLGFYDARCDALVERMIQWQWADGGWNCDKRPQACHSSFHESLLPMRSLFHYASQTANAEARAAANRAARMFLERKLFRRKSDGELIDPRFLELHFPYHWRYNILHALKGMAEAGLIGDRRCGEALRVLKSKRLADGGFASPKRPYKLGLANISMVSPADFGPYGAARANPFVTIDALYVLRRAAGGRGSGG
jgi:hypothetical protein